MTAKPGAGTEGLAAAGSTEGRATGWAKVRRWLMPGAAEADPGFRAEIDRLSVRALWIVAGVMAAMPLLGALFHGIVQWVEPRENPAPWLIPLNLTVAALLAALSRWDRVRRYARPVALAAGYVAAVALSVGELLGGAEPSEAQLTSMIDVAVVMLVAVAAGPFLPAQIFGLAVAINGTHFAIARFALSRDLTPQISLHHYAGMDLFALLCAALSAVLYQRLLEQYRSRQAQLDAQSRLLISENAAAMGRFAATLAHELNSPLGALGSTLDSLERIGERRAASDSGQAARLDAAAAGLFATARTATESLHQTIRRMERFTALDRAETASVDLGQLLEDTAAAVRPELGGGARIEVECAWRGTATLRPRTVTAVLVRLLRYVAQAGGGSGVVELNADKAGEDIVIVVQGPATAMDSGRAERIFEPAFRVESSRVVGGNWSLFQARQAVQETGGDIQAAFENERIRLTVRIPADVG